MQTTDTIFNAWFTNTNSLLNDWKNMAEKWNGEQGKVWEDVGKMQQQWMNGFHSMVSNMSGPMSGAAAGPFSNETARDAFANMLKSMDIYTRLFQLWQPVFAHAQRTSLNSAQELWKLIDPAAFRSFTDRLFGMDGNAAMQAFINQLAQLSTLWGNTMAGAANNYARMSSNGIPFFTSMAQMNPQTVAKWYAEMFQSAQRSFAPWFGTTDIGSAPPIEPVSAFTERWSQYLAKASQMQNLLYRTGMSAWEKVMQAMAARSAEGRPINNFDEFYNEWSAINEQEYVALFNTEEYAALQGELLKLQSEAARTYEKQMEAALQAYPIVFRSQLEEVHKVNHELRSRIGELERLVTELQAAGK